MKSFPKKKQLPQPTNTQLPPKQTPNHPLVFFPQKNPGGEKVPSASCPSWQTSRPPTFRGDVVCFDIEKSHEVFGVRDTPLKFNMETQKWRLGRCFSFSNGWFSDSMFVFWGVYSMSPKNNSLAESVIFFASDDSFSFESWSIFWDIRCNFRRGYVKKDLQKAGPSVGVLIPFLEVPSWRHLAKKNTKKDPEKIIFCGGFLHHWLYHIHLVHGSKISVPKNSL